MLVLVVAIVLATGSGSAVAAQISSVFVTNGPANPVPVREQGNVNVNVANSALPVTESVATQLLFSGTIHPGVTQSVDVSGAKEIRVYVGGCPAPDNVRMGVPSTGAELVAPACGTSEVYEVPGTSVTFFMDGSNGDDIQLTVFGRAN
jgi:hypothetical protein